MTNHRSGELAALVGIDWADKHHTYVLQEVGSDTLERGQIPQTPEGLAEFAAELRQRFGGRSVGICLETSKGPLVHGLLEHAFVVLYPVNPKTLKRFREAFATSGAKDDPEDAELLLEIISKHRDRLRPWTPDDEQTRKLARLTQDRRDAIELRTRLTQELRAELKGYFPHALEWAGSDLSSALATNFLLKWPTLTAVQRAKPETIRKFYHAHNCRRGALIEARLQAMRSAKPLTTDKAVIETSVLKVEMLARQLQTLGPSLARYEELIAELFAEHPDAELFRSLPGSGPALGPRLLVAFGTDRERFESATEVQEYTGIAPVTERSGQFHHVRWRWSASTFIRQTFHEFARHSIPRSTWARAFYQIQRERGKKHHAAIRSLAFKWIRVLYRCWQQKTPYEEARYIQTLRERGSPLAARIEHHPAA